VWVGGSFRNRYSGQVLRLGMGLNRLGIRSGVGILSAWPLALGF
jgi:hypothetical protein